MSDFIPRNAGDITIDWLQEIVFQNVKMPTILDIKLSDVGEGRGTLSETVKVEFVFEEAVQDDILKSVIVKLQPSTTAFKRRDRKIHAFEREVSFYRDIAPNVPVRLPRIYYTEKSTEAGAIVMEDLENLEGGDQVIGLTHEQTLMAAREIAKLHAAYWNNPALETLDWAPWHDHFNADDFAEHWPDFSNTEGEKIGAEALALGHRISENFDWLEAKIASRPMTILHGDLRADNLMFNQDRSKQEVAIVDWQLVSKNLATIDIARMLGGSESIEERQGHQMEIVHAWHAELLKSGVNDYSLTEAEYDFRLAALHCVTIPVHLHLAFGQEVTGRIKELFNIRCARFFSSALELDAEKLLPK